LLLLYLLGVSFGFEPSRLHFFLLLVSLSWVVWKAGRSAILGWGRLERLHRLVEQERWEIEHHRSQEKEELRALYAAKGFHGKLLDEAVEVLMADDNRLLQVMLEEELGLQLESYEHPLKQAFGALVGGVAAAALLALSLFFHPYWAPVLSALIVIIGSAAWSARRERNRPLPALIWNLAAALLAAAFALVLAP
jgi:VIT1/CCC1 family predicted Fe2+/Mn2+ transporter